MANPPRPLFAPLHDDLKSLAADLREMAAARWQLARLELLGQRDRAVRLVIVCVVATVMALTALPLLVWCLADSLDGWHSISRTTWLGGISVALLLLAALGSYLAIRRFRRQATGLQETLEELREDILWLREWAGRESPPDQAEEGPSPPGGAA
jgi:uncharacterized membrane protein YqjE